MHALIALAVYTLLANVGLYHIVAHYAMKIVPVPTKALLSFSLFCCLTAVVLTPLDLYQSIHDNHVYPLTNFWRFLYWISFLFGYVIFVVISEKDRVGESRSFLESWVDFYRQRAVLFVGGGIAAIVLVVVLLWKGALQV
jgi:hypothetical protein